MSRGNRGVVVCCKNKPCRKVLSHQSGVLGAPSGIESPGVWGRGKGVLRGCDFRHSGLQGFRKSSRSNRNYASQAPVACPKALQPLPVIYTNIPCEGHFDAILVDSTDMGMAQGRTAFSGFSQVYQGRFCYTTPCRKHMSNVQSLSVRLQRGRRVGPAMLHLTDKRVRHVEFGVGSSRRCKSPLRIFGGAITCGARASLPAVGRFVQFTGFVTYTLQIGHG